MLTAIKTVHAKNGPWVTNGGYEYNVVLIAAVLALAEDNSREHPGRVATGALLTGALGALGAHLLNASQPAPPVSEAAGDTNGTEPAAQDE